MAAESVSSKGKESAMGRDVSLLIVVLVLLSPSGFLQTPARDTPTPAADSPGYDNIAKLHSVDGYFIENRGQVADGVKYYSMGNPSIGFRDDGVMFVLTEVQGNGRTPDGSSDKPIRSPIAAIKDRPIVRFLAYFLRFEGANIVAPVGNERLQFNSNFLFGNDSSKWKTDIPNYQEIIYRGLYKGIDLVYRRGAAGLKYEFVVSPGADTGAIRMRYEGIESIGLNGEGIVVLTAFGEVHDSAPLSFQGDGMETRCIFAITAPLAYGFECRDRDISKTLIIDPLIYSTFLGGSDKDGNWWTAITVDSEGNAYIAGDTLSPDFPVTPGAYDTTSDPSDHPDVFVIKLNPAGNALVYSTYLGGSQEDYGRSIAVDSAGNACVTGSTYSPDFPTTPGAYDTAHGYVDSFITKLNPSGNALNYSTFLGGSQGDDEAWSIALDASGNAYVTGWTDSPDFPTTPGALDTTFNGGTNDVFVTKLNAIGSGLVYSSYLGGSIGSDAGNSIAVDVYGNAYVSGYTTARDFPVTRGAFDETFEGNNDVFVTKLDSSGSVLVYSTFLGGTGLDDALSVAVDASGFAYVTGLTDSCFTSRTFPVTPGAFNVTGDSAGSTFVTKLNSNGTALVYSTFLGGDGWDAGFSVAVDSAGNAYLSGTTYSNDFPITPDAVDKSCNCTDFESDAFVTKLNPNGSALLYSTFLGGAEGSESVRGASLALDSADDIYVTGSTRSSDFPVTAGAFDTVFNGSQSSPDVFISKMAIGENTPPTISLFRATPAAEESPVVFVVDASDPDGDPLTYCFDFESDGVFDVSGPNNTASHVWGDDYKGIATVRVSDGSLTATDTTAVSVLNVLPSGTLSVTSAHHEGSPITFSAYVTDPGSDDVFLTWKWGFGALDDHSTYYNDGVSPDPYPSPDIHPRDITDVKMHTYGDNGAFTITVFVQDDDSGSNGTTLTITATPDNLPPSVSVNGGTVIDEGQSVALTATATDPGSDDITFAWSWGEGSSDSKTYFNNGIGPDPPNSPGGTYPFTATDARTHSYGDNGIYTATLTVNDDDGGSATWSGQIVVNNLPPSVAPIGELAVAEGSLLSVTADATDPGSDDLTFTWTFELGPSLLNVHYNDGIGPDPPNSPSGTYPFLASDTVAHTYGDNGEFVVSLVVTDDDGGSSTLQFLVNVSNVLPSILPIGPFEVNEGDPLVVKASAFDPGSDDLTFTWSFEYGPLIEHVYYNDGVGPDPVKSPNGTFPVNIEDAASHTYGDNGVFTLVLTVHDDDMTGGGPIYRTTVTVHNVPPTIVDAKVFMLADISIRVAGEKWHDVILRLFDDGQEVGWAQVIRYPGSPDDQMATLHDVEITLGRTFSAVVYYTPADDPVNGQPNGANPVWLIISWENGMETRLHHTFNVQHNDTYVWTVDNLHIYAVNQRIHLRATATDPGSDDLTFTWDTGDGRTLTGVYYNNGVSPDPYPSPEVHPMSATDEQVIVYSVAGTYTITLTVTDDDGGTVTVPMTIQVGG